MLLKNNLEPYDGCGKIMYPSRSTKIASSFESVLYSALHLLYTKQALNGKYPDTGMMCIFINGGKHMDQNFMSQNFKIMSSKMIEDQLKTRGIKSESVLDAMSNVPRHLFVSENQHSCAYNDSPLPIGLGQTISQPYIVAFMTEQLEPFPGMKVLEIGTGSGYQAAILAYLQCEVYTIEFLEELASKAQKTLAALNFDCVRIKHGNGYKGWPEEAPFDAVIVTAAPDIIPEKLIEQLNDGGKMIIPVGKTYSVQLLKLIIKKDGRIFEKELLPVRFVPMVE